jgi:hypothetical protein
VCLVVADRDLNRMYEGSGVVFVRDIPEMSRVIEELLSNEAKLKSLSAMSVKFMTQKVSSKTVINGVCGA